MAPRTKERVADVPADPDRSAEIVDRPGVRCGRDESPVDAGALSADAVVMDAVYEPERTRLLRDAESRGAKAIPGKWMLVHQAAEQIRLWTGRDAPLEVMATAFDAAG